MNDSKRSTIPALRGPVPLSHHFLGSFLRNGDTAIDATCGNGHDTLLLAGLIGENGHVWGFDIQGQAITETGRKLEKAGLSSRVTLLQKGHEELAEHVAGPVQVVLFNLGYLPGGDRSIITRPETTAAALEQSLGLLTAGGIVLMSIYPGHGGGADEQTVVESWAADLNPHVAHCWRMGQTNVTPTAPYLLLVQKAA
jgi:hypothetical protein